MIRCLGGGVTRFGLPGLALGLVLAWGSGFRGEPAAAQTGASRAPGSNPAGMARPTEASKSSPARGGDPGGTLAVIANPTGPVQWLYLIDTRKQAFAVYRVDTTKGAVKLEAARRYRWDLDLDQYNNQGLEPADVAARVQALVPSTQ